MPINGKVLADGQMATTKTAMYTVPAATTAYIRNINLFNTNAAEQTIIIYLNTSGTSRQIARIILAQNESAHLLDLGECIVLEAADVLEGLTTTATAVDFVVLGGTE